MFQGKDGKYKVYVRRPWWEIAGIIGGILLIVGIVASVTVTVFLAAGARIINYNLTPEFIASDQEGRIVYTAHPKRFSTRMVEVQPRVSYLWGLLSFDVGAKERRYDMIFVLEDGTEFQAEVDPEERRKIGVFDGVEIDYVIGRSGRYYVKALRVGDSGKNGLGARIWRGIKGK